MSKLIPMEEAAQLLGISVDRLTELRSNNEIFGYRDGSNWKFKRSELERVSDELGLAMTAGSSSDVNLSESLGFDLTDSAKDMLVDDESSQDSIGSISSIGRELESAEYMEDSSVELDSIKPKTPSGSEVDLGGDDDDAINLVDSGRLSAKGSQLPGSQSDLKLEGDSASDDSSGSVFDDDDDEQLSFGSSSLRLASESSKKLDGDSDNDILDEEHPKGDSPSDTGKMAGDGGGEDDLLMSEEDLFSDDLSLADSMSFEESAELSSDFEDSDMVLDDSDSSSEVSLEANESGINLSANESGISLADEPLELGGSDIDALELPEDDDMIVLEDAAGPDQATMMQEDDFNLTPLEASLDDEDSSTGSQVIALEDSEIYADESAGMVLGEEEFEAQPALLDDTAGGDFGGGMYDPSMGGQMVPAGVGQAVIPEAPYSLFQILSLGLVAALLSAGAMIAYNLAQNMWMPEDQVIGSGVLNFFLKLTGMDKG